MTEMAKQQANRRLQFHPKVQRASPRWAYRLAKSRATIIQPNQFVQTGGTKGATSFLGFDPQQIRCTRWKPKVRKLQNEVQKKGGPMSQTADCVLHKIEMKA